MKTVKKNNDNISAEQQIVDSYEQQIKDLGKLIILRSDELSRLERKIAESIAVHEARVKALEAVIKDLDATQKELDVSLAPRMEKIVKLQKELFIKEADLKVIEDRWHRLYSDKGVGFKV